MPFRFLLTLVLMVPAGWPTPVVGSAIPVPGGRFGLDPADGRSLVPRHWKPVGEGGRESWLSGPRRGLLLKANAGLETIIKVAPLGEKEARGEVRWQGIAHVDYWGVDESGEGVLLLQVFHEGQRLAESRVTIENPVVDRGPGVSYPPTTIRTWAVIEAPRFKGVLGKAVTLRVSNEGPRGVIVEGVGFCRTPVAPDRRLLGKPNGQLGPDLLGAGSLGFEAMAVHQQSALQILSVRAGGPAARAGLKGGEVIVEINRRPLPENTLEPGFQWIEQSHEALLGKAVLGAGQRDGLVELAVLREGVPRRSRLKLERPMELSSMIPGEDKAAAALYRDTIGFLVRTQRGDGSWSSDPVRTALSALALLATRRDDCAGPVKRAVDYLLNRYPEAEGFGRLGFWHAAYTGILYSEYWLATGDDRVRQRLLDIRDWVLTGIHTSKWGMPALGHGVGHLPYGQKALMAPLAHLLVFEALAQRLGQESRIWETLWPYIESSWSDPDRIVARRPGHGAMGYNPSYKDLDEFWSRTGLCAMACALRGEKRGMRTALTQVMVDRHPWIRNSHAYGEPGGALGLLGLNLAAPQDYRRVIAEYAWWFALAWEPGYGLRFTQPHMGAPYMGQDDLINAAYALVLAAPRRTLHLTGGTDRDWLDTSLLPAPLSEVRAKRNREGLVWLEGRVPGPEIVYTIDGSDPGESAALYEQPFLLKGPATLKARTRSGNKRGPLTEIAFAPAKTRWQIVSASGHSRIGKALQRADRLIDGDPNLCWLTDNGEDVAGYPHHFVLDLSEATEVRGLILHYAEKDKMPGEWSVSVSMSADDKPRRLAAGTLGEHVTSQEITFPGEVKARFIRFEAKRGMTSEAKAMMIRELEVVR